MEEQRMLKDFPAEHLPADRYQVANWLWTEGPGDERYNDTALASRAADLMKAAGWKFVQHCSVTGEKQCSPPPCPSCGEPLFERPSRFDKRYTACRECGNLTAVTITSEDGVAFEMRKRRKS